MHYGAYADEQFLTDYGFVPHRNQSAVASLTLDANDADRFERACTSLGLVAGSVSVPLEIVVHQKYRRDADANYTGSAEDRDNALDLNPLKTTHLVAACVAGVATNSEWLKHLEAAKIPLPDADEDQGMFTIVGNDAEPLEDWFEKHSNRPVDDKATLRDAAWEKIASAAKRQVMCIRRRRQHITAELDKASVSTERRMQTSISHLLQALDNYTANELACHGASRRETICHQTK
jgi:hypothetical protein